MFSQFLSDIFLGRAQWQATSLESFLWRSYSEVRSIFQHTCTFHSAPRPGKLTQSMLFENEWLVCLRGFPFLDAFKEHAFVGVPLKKRHAHIVYFEECECSSRSFASGTRTRGSTDAVHWTMAPWLHCDPWRCPSTTSHYPVMQSDAGLGQLPEASNLETRQRPFVHERPSHVSVNTHGMLSCLSRVCISVHGSG